MKTTILVLLATLGVSSAAHAVQKGPVSCRKIFQGSQAGIAESAKDISKKESTALPALVK